jgi:hypothetical protein
MVMDAAGPGLEAVVDEPPNPVVRKFYDILEAADTLIWEGCTSHLQLSLVSRLLNIKFENTMSEKCFNQVVQLIKEVAPDRNKIPDNFYDIKKLVSWLGLPIQKLTRVRMNACFIGKGDDACKDCKFCGHPRNIQKMVRKGSRQKEIPFKNMYYFPITPKLQWLYVSKMTALHMRWHADNIAETGIPAIVRLGNSLTSVI